MDGGTVHRTFCDLSRQIGLRGVSASHGPRLHDFRHRFAFQTLLRWYRTGKDLERRLPIVDLSRPRPRHLLVSHQHPGINGSGWEADGGAVGRASMRKSPDFPALLQSFFTQRLIAQRKASPHTIASIGTLSDCSCVLRRNDCINHRHNLLWRT